MLEDDRGKERGYEGIWKRENPHGSLVFTQPLSTPNDRVGEMGNTPRERGSCACLGAFSRTSLGFSSLFRYFDSLSDLPHDRKAGNGDSTTQFISSSFSFLYSFESTMLFSSEIVPSPETALTIQFQLSSR